jgi:hypothetical protein
MRGSIRQLTITGPRHRHPNWFASKLFCAGIVRQWFRSRTIACDRKMLHEAVKIEGFAAGRAIGCQSGANLIKLQKLSH